MTKRVAIIGAGPSGLAQLRAFQSAAEKGAEVPRLCALKSNPTGAVLWNYTWRTGSINTGNRCTVPCIATCGRMGQKRVWNLRIIRSRNISANRLPLTRRARCCSTISKGRVKKAGVRDMIRFETVVRNVDFAEGKFTVKVKDLPNDREYSEEL